MSYYFLIPVGAPPQRIAGAPTSAGISDALGGATFVPATTPSGCAFFLRETAVAEGLDYNPVASTVGYYALNGQGVMRLVGPVVFTAAAFEPTRWAALPWSGWAGAVVGAMLLDVHRAVVEGATDGFETLGQPERPDRPVEMAEEWRQVAGMSREAETIDPRTVLDRQGGRVWKALRDAGLDTAEFVPPPR